MHELSICRGIVQAALEEYEKLEPRPRRLTRVRVVAGELHQLVPDHLVMAFEVLTRDTPAEGSTLELETVPVTGRCRGCGWEGEIRPPVFQCAECEAFDIEMEKGRELYLDRLEVEPS
jgi:hydrogenase nickel incorporation protein HypA/HybF